MVENPHPLDTDSRHVNPSGLPPEKQPPQPIPPPGPWEPPGLEVRRPHRPGGGWVESPDAEHSFTHLPDGTEVPPAP